MRNRFRIAFAILVLAAVGGLVREVFKPGEPEPAFQGKSELFPVLPPIARVNPSIRHSMTVRVPTSLRVIRTDDTLRIGWEPLQTTNLAVGTNMVVGCKIESCLYRDGVAEKFSRSDNVFKEWFGGSSLGGGLDFGSTDIVLHRKERRTLLPANAYSVERHCVVFETDIPPQHFWQPTGGKYRVLWERNFKETAKPE